jgi:hypothetical protein
MNLLNMVKDLESQNRWGEIHLLIKENWDDPLYKKHIEPCENELMDILEMGSLDCVFDDFGFNYDIVLRTHTIPKYED